MRLTGEEVLAAEHRSFSVLLRGEGIVSFPLLPQAHAVRVITENTPPDSCASLAHRGIGFIARLCFSRLLRLMVRRTALRDLSPRPLRRPGLSMTSPGAVFAYGKCF